MSVKGFIALWSGAIVDIPAPWVLADGAGGIPDLRNKFVVGAGDTYAPDAAGGVVQHVHTFTGDGHTHFVGPPPGLAAAAGYDATYSTDPATGTTNNGNNLPQYYALAYIYHV